VRGVSELSILKQIMQKLPKIDNRDPHPHEVFDLIAGTSTGG
jgi:patatin-like phospholipase/acyl hydrolase